MERYDPRRPGALPHAGTFNNNVLTMAAGLPGMTEVLTAEAATALAGRGDALRARLNESAAARGAPMQVTGAGSLMTVHFTDRPVISPADIPAVAAPLNDLFFFDMLDRGIYLARRGRIALSLAVTADDLDRFADAVEDFLDVRQPLLPHRD